MVVVFCTSPKMFVTNSVSLTTFELESPQPCFTTTRRYQQSNESTIKALSSAHQLTFRAAAVTVSGFVALAALRGGSSAESCKFEENSPVTKIHL